MSPFTRFFGKDDKSLMDEETGKHSDEIVQIAVNKINANRFQPRTIFDEEKIKELAQTIHTHGMIQPIVVRKLADDRFEIIAGERRWRAVTSLEWEYIPAIVREMSDKETASVALIENLQREELTVIEEAQAYSRLLELHNITQEALAQRIGKSQSTIANKLRLLNLPEEVQTALLNKQITERHARALIKLKDAEQQLKVLSLVIEQHLNVKQTEELVNKINLPKESNKQKKPKLKGISKDVRIAMNTIRQSLSMVSDTGVKVETDEQEMEDFYQITIKIPKKN